MNELAKKSESTESLKQPIATEVPAPKKEPAKGEIADAASAEATIVIYQLKFLEAGMMTATLRQVMEGLTITTDARMNSIIVSADESVHESVRGIVEQLDQPRPDSTPVIGAPASIATVEEQLADLMGDQKVLLGKTSSKTDAATQEQLRRVLAREFELRQKLQRLEIQLLRQRLDTMQNQIELKDALKEQIINRRLQGLID